MSSSTFSVSGIMEKAESRDKDLRHMALYDLHTELQKENVKLDETSQRQLADVVLHLLDDSCSDVQGQAVKCLGPLVTKMSKFQVEKSVATLSASLVEGEDEKRDIATIALKTVVSRLPVANAVGPVKKCLPLILKALEGDRPEVKLDALEVLNDILKRFGNVISASHSILQTAFMAELQNKRAAVRKRAITALSFLAQYMTDRLFGKLVDDIIFGIRTAQGGEDLKTYIQLTSQIAKTAGHRLGRKMEEFVDLLLKAAEDIGRGGDEDDEDEEGESDEVREYIMQAMESFVTRCQSEVTPFVELILILCNEYIEYDPNFSYDDSSDEEGEGEEGDMDVDGGDDSDEEFGGDSEEDELGEEDDGDYSSDDDITWKVRKAAAQCLLALIRTKPECLDSMYENLCSIEDHPLLRRFKEREESVKLDVFKVFEALLKQTITTTTTSTGELVITQHEQISNLRETKGLIMRRLLVQLKSRSARVKHAVFSAMKDLVFTLQGGLEEYIGPVVEAAKVVLDTDEQHTGLKLVTLQFLALLLEKHPGDCFIPVLDDLAESVYKRISDKYYKITAESMNVCAQLAAPVLADGSPAKIDKLFLVVFEKLKVQDIDQDVKENTIRTMGEILATFENSLSSRLSDVLTVLGSRLKNETTRLVACKAIGKVAASALDLSSVINDIIAELSTFLRKDDRPLRQAALQTLTMIADKYAARMSNEVVVELSKLVNDQDLHLAHLALDLAFALYEKGAQQAPIRDIVLPQILILLNSSTLQGTALASCLKVVNGLVDDVGFRRMLDQILGAMIASESDVSKQVYVNIAKSISSLAKSASDGDRAATITRFQRDLASEDRKAKLLALFTIGEIGRTVDLSSNSEIVSLIQSNFDSSSEEIKNAASYALGNVSIGNLAVFLPQILESIGSESTKKYLLIHSLKEVIVRSDEIALEPYLETLLPLLKEHSQSSEEGVRNVVSECLGKLCLVFYERVMPQIALWLKGSRVWKARSAFIAAVKYVILEIPQVIDENLKMDLPAFLERLNKRREKKVGARRAAILLLTSVIHNKPSIIRDSLHTFMPHLYVLCKFDKRLERTINLGPFKHIVDDGLECRKSAFECLDTIISSPSIREVVDPLKFVQGLVDGFDDKNDDVKMLTHIIAVKCAQFFPDATCGVIGAVCKGATKVLKHKPRSEALQQQKERHEELVKSTLRAIYAFTRVKGSSDILPFTEITDKLIPNNQRLKGYYEALKAEDDEEFIA